MHTTIPTDLLELKARFETWRATRKYVREPIPDELRHAAAFGRLVAGVSTQSSSFSA